MPESGPSAQVLLVIAAPAEARAVAEALGATAPEPWERRQMAPGIAMLVSGIGKANAAGAAGRFARPGDRILNIGVAGALGSGGPGDLVIATASVFADEGAETPGGFLDCTVLGFPLGGFSGSAVPVSTQWSDQLSATVSTLEPRRGPIATVSTCSGTDALARQVVARTGAIAESMEGAAVGLIAHRLGLDFAEVRVVSNTTGDRDRQRWDLHGALARLSDVIGLLARRVRG